jgi:RNA polymerase sigma factor (sigma-70 family)
MGNSPLTTVVRHLRRVIGTPAGPAPTDAELLERFARQRDAAAFELLVWRHQRMVFGVCRRVLRDQHDAEDAFQATFLALVRKASSISNRQALAGWLYQVAYRIACRAHAGVIRRSRRERSGSELAFANDAQDTAGELVHCDLGPLLDHELQRLPAKYRVPLVLCYLEGKTYDEAAAQLGCPKGTLSTRLTRARELLRARLTRRGLALSAPVLVAALCAEAASAAAPAVLVAATVQSVASGAAVSAKVAALTQGVIQAMFWTKMKIVFSLTAVIVLVGAGGVLLVPGSFSTSQAQTPGPDGPGAGDPQATKEAPTWGLRTVLETPDILQAMTVSPGGQILAGGGKDGRVRLWDLTTGKEIGAMLANKGTVRTLAFSPDGKVLAGAGQGDGVAGQAILWDVPTRKLLSTMHDADAALISVRFSQDGRALATFNGQGDVQLWAVPSGKQTRSTAVLKGQLGSLVYAPGDKLIAATMVGEDVVFLVDAETGKILRVLNLREGQRIAGDEPLALAFSPDGKRLVIAGGKAQEAKLVRIWDVETGKILVEISADQNKVRSVAFSPDGKVLATGGQDHDVRLWDVASGKQLAVLKGHTGPVVVIVIAKDGTTIITASGDRTVRIWTPDMAPAAKVEQPSAIGERLDTLLRNLLKTKKNDEQIIEALCLATLARLPTEGELRTMAKHVANKKDRQQALTDVVWALVNSLEFHGNVEALRKLDRLQDKK